MISANTKKGLHHIVPIQYVMLRKTVKRTKSILCLILALLMLFSLCMTASAEDNETAEAEEVIDAVAEKEAAIAAAAAEAAAEATKINDVVDMDARPEDVISEEIMPSSTSPTEANNISSLSGPVLALIVGVVLVVSGLGVVAASNKKIKAGKKAKSGK